MLPASSLNYFSLLKSHHDYHDLPPLAETKVTIDGKNEVEIELLEDSEANMRFGIKNLKTGKIIVVEYKWFILLSESAAKRENLLRRNRDWFDCPSNIFEAEVARIATSEDPVQRFEMAKEWRASSITSLYENLKRPLLETTSVRFADLIPQRPEGLLWFFRLDDQPETGPNFHAVLNNSAETLINEEGLLLATLRFLGLPVPLPNFLTQTIDVLSKHERKQFLKHILSLVRSPISKIHFIYLLVRYSEERASYFRLARCLIKYLVKDLAGNEFEAFQSILVWVDNVFETQRGLQSWSTTTRLTTLWFHAHMLYDILETSGASLSRIRDNFNRKTLGTFYNIFNRESDVRFDIAHPKRITRLTFLISGISYCVGDRLEEIISDELLDEIRRLVLLEISAQQILSTDLMRDPLLAKDSLGAFLGNYTGELMLLLLNEQDHYGIYESSFRERVTGHLIALSQDPSQLPYWLDIYAIIGDLELYESLQDDFKTIIMQT